MARYKPYDYDQLRMVAVSLDEQLIPGTLEYAIHHLIEERLDTSSFDEKFRNDTTGRMAYDPSSAVSAGIGKVKHLQWGYLTNSLRTC